MRLRYSDESNLSTGSILSEFKDPDILRLYFQNIHGISKNQWLDWVQAGRQVRKFSIDIVGNVETNILWTESLRRQAQYLIRNSARTQAHTAVASSIDSGTTNFQPGGTATTVFGKWTGRLVTTTNDKSGMGRWSGVILNTKHNQKLIIVTVYMPTKSDGNNTTYQQQWRILRNKYGGDPDPRKKLLQDLETEIIKWTHNSHEVIVMMDANDNITKTNSKILPFLAKTKLTPLHHTFPDSSYDRGSQCIDFIFATEKSETSNRPRWIHLVLRWSMAI